MLPQLQLTRSATKMEELHAELNSKQNEVEYLSEKNNELQQESYSYKISTKAQSDTIASLHESMRKAKLDNERLESLLKENSNRLEESNIYRQKLQRKCD